MAAGHLGRLSRSDTIPAGGAIFSRLEALGVDCVLANSGTDFPPIIEGLAEAAARGGDLPCAITIPHEQVSWSLEPHSGGLDWCPPAALTRQKSGPDVHRTAHARRVGTADALPGALEDALLDTEILPD